MKAKLYQTKNPIFPYKFRCPIDKKSTYVTEKCETAYFGACGAYFGRGKAIEAKINFKTMEVISK